MGDGGLRVLGDDAYRGGDGQEQKDVQYQFACDTRVYSPRSRQQSYSLHSDRSSEGNICPLVKKVKIEWVSETLE